MSYKYIFLPSLLFSFILLPLASAAQRIKTDQISETPYTKGGLFNNDEILHFKLSGNLSKLFSDRSDSSSYYPVLIEYFNKDSNKVSIHLNTKTRGHFRRLKSNCKMPPLLLDFPKEDKTVTSVFMGQNKLKLVVPCQGDDYVIKEWLVYKLYNLITDKSFTAKLVLVDFEDSSTHRIKKETHYCILLEDEKKMSIRNDMYIWKKQMIAMQDINTEAFKKMAVFQYMIGNTDWSVPYLQNIVLITNDSSKAPFAIPYDFDHAGIVNAPYANPASELGIESVRERIYRGFCEKNKNSFLETFALFNHLKNDIYNLYINCPLLNHSYIKFVIRYLDNFYKIINNQNFADAEFRKPCRTNMHIELKGLKK